MPARDFDKALQDKVQQLRLEPSPKVWAGVAGELNRKRRRRSAAWILAAAAVVTGITFLIVDNPSGKEIAGKEILSAAETSQKESHGITNAVPFEESTKNPNKENLNSKAIDPNSTLPVLPVPNTKSTLTTAGNTIHKETNAPDKNEQITPGKPTVPEENYSRKAVKLATTSEVTASIGTLSQDAASTSHSLDPAEISLTLKKAGSPSVTASVGNKPGNQVSRELLVSPKISKPNRWHSSVVFGGGASLLVESGLQQYNTINNDYLSQVAVPAGIATIQQRPSDVKAGPAFFIGAQVNRNISKKWRAGIGIQYAYLSNRITVGTTPDSAIVLYTRRRELIAASNVPYKASGNSGNNFNNQFHFIQLPLEMTLSIGAKQRWDYHAGMNVGYLIGVNALQYNNQAGVYYRDNDNYRKWQTAILMGFHYTFPDVKKMPLQVGPFAQYHLTSLDKTSSDKHLLNFGIEARLQFN